MPTLHWIGKEKVVNHHLDVPFKTLEKQYTFKDGKESEEGTSENKIIHGDNLEALKSLLPEYEGKIKCIYIDPPYNTGNEGWVYNDNVNHPKIKKWLGEVVGKEGEDLSRHDKWLCMMYPRLKLLHKLLSDDGVIVIHIDENEYVNLKLVMNEIFGQLNNFGTIIWDKKNPKGDSQKVSYQHESIIIYAKDINKSSGKFSQKKENAMRIINKAKKLFEKIGDTDLPQEIKDLNKKYELSERFLKNNVIKYNLELINIEFSNWIKKQKFTAGEKAYRYIDEEGRVYRGVSMAWPNKTKAPDDYWVPLVHPISKKECPLPSRGWRYPSSTMQDLLGKGQILFGEDEYKQPERKYYLDENTTQNISSIIEFGGSDDNLQRMLDYKFENPKPFEFSKKIIDIFLNKNDIILDSFAGSGTTAHAVLNLNKEDGGNRKFILVEMEDYANNITAERVKRVIKGYGKGKKAVEGTGGDFEFLKLGKPLFDEDGYINENQPLEDIRKYVYYSETKTNTGYSANPKNKYYLGKRSVTGYYFYYKDNAVTTLDLDFASKIKIKADQYIVYADKCTLSQEFMRENNIIFKKIPRDIAKI